MITNACLFDYVDQAVSRKLGSRFSSLDNDLPDLSNKIKFKLWRMRKSIRPESYKSYVNMSVNNTYQNYLRDLFVRAKRENATSFQTVFKSKGHVEIVPDIEDTREPDLDVNYEVFMRTLLPRHRQVFQLLLEGCEKEEIMEKLKMSRRMYYKYREQVKTLFKEYLKTV